MVATTKAAKYAFWMLIPMIDADGGDLVVLGAGTAVGALPAKVREAA